MGGRAPGSNKRTPEGLSLWKGESKGVSVFLFLRIAAPQSIRTAQLTLCGPIKPRLHPIGEGKPGLTRACAHSGPYRTARRTIQCAERRSSPFGGRPILASWSMPEMYKQNWGKQAISIAGCTYVCTIVSVKENREPLITTPGDGHPGEPECQSPPAFYHGSPHRGKADQNATQRLPHC